MNLMIYILKLTCKPKLCILFIFLSITSTQALAQSKSWEMQKTFDKIKTGLKKGDKAALNQLIELTKNKDKVTDYLGYHQMENTVSGIAWRTFYEYYIFDSLPLEEKFQGKQELLEKYTYDNFPKMEFCFPAQAFLITPIDNRPVRYKLTRKELTNEKDLEVALQNYKTEVIERLEHQFANDALSTIDEIAKLKNPSAEKFLNSCFTEDFFKTYPFADHSKLYAAAAMGLRFYPSMETISFILKITENNLISQNDGLDVLQSITNIPFKDKILDEKYPCRDAAKYINYFKTVEDMRIYGYEQRFNIKLTDYKNKVEFLGNIILISDDEDAEISQKNALLDIMETKDPLALKYTSALVYRHRSKWNEYHWDDRKDYSPVGMIEKYTKLSVEIERSKEVYTSEYENELSRLNYLLYWTTHYKDYKWDDTLKLFINHAEQIAQPDSVTLYYEMLNSPNPVTAKKAFLALTESDPVKVKNILISKSELIEAAHSKHYGALPMFPDRRLKALVVFFDYCKKNNITYKPNNSLKHKLDSLSLLYKSASAEYKLEDQLIATVTLNELTPIEYWAGTNGEDATYPIGRVLDKLYTKHFDSIVSNEQQLRLFLKKAIKYEEFGIIGICNKYLWKFQNCHQSILEKIKALKKQEKDEDILKAIDAVLNNKYWHSECLGHIPALYENPINIITTLKHIEKLSSKKNAEEYKLLQYNQYFVDKVSDNEVSQAQLKPMIDCLHTFAMKNKDDSFDYTTALSFSYWLKLHELPCAEQYKKAIELAQGEVREDLNGWITLHATYKDIPAMIQTYYNKSPNINNWFINSHIEGDLGIPINMSNKQEIDTLLSRFLRLSEQDLYKAYANDFGLQNIFLADGNLNYEMIYNILEYDVVDAFVGGGGGRRASTAKLVIRILEIKTQTQLGFHWRLEYVRKSEVHSFHRRACAWMKYLRDKNLAKIPAHKPASFSN